MNLLQLFKKQEIKKVETIHNEHGEEVDLDWYLKSLVIDMKYCNGMIKDLKETLSNLRPNDKDLKANIESDIRRYERLGKEFMKKYNKHKGRNI